MNTVTNLIIDEKDSDAVFIFPSEAAAVSRRKEFLGVTGIKAVKNRRFVSWDRFKEDITLHDRDEKPVNSILRRLFSADIIRRNSDEQIFTSLVPAEYSSQAGAFTDSICRVLPELEALVRKIETSEAVLDSGEAALSADYFKLYHDYLRFMRANGLFEPSWELPDLKAFDGSCYIICPEIIEDFGEYEALLTAAGCRIVNQAEIGAGMIKLYENSVIETDTVLSEIASLLAEGTAHTGIAVTVADDKTAELLLSKARLRGIPLNYRSGSPLSDYPAGRLPELIRACRSSGFSIASMKNLLLYRAFIWKDAETAAALIRFGIEYRCLKNTSVGPKTTSSEDVWASRLKSIAINDSQRPEACRREAMLKFYKKLKSGIEKITGASSFEALSREFQIFISTFLNTETEHWNAECEQVFQRTREVLSSLRETVKRLENVLVSDPLGLWIELLNEKIYVQQQAEEGIAVFPYRVSALINPSHHFIIGLSHDAAAVASKAFSFLTDQQRKDIGAAELNMTDDFIRIFALSGDDVRFSCSTDTADGAALPPGFFISSGTISRIKSAAMEDGFFTDPIQSENRWWDRACRAGFRLEEAGELPILSLSQLEGFAYASAAFMSEKGFDAVKQSFPADAAGQLASELSDDGFFRVSATALNRWTECRFNMLLTDVLNIRENEYILRAEDPWTAGSVMHDILLDFFTELKSSGTSFRLAGNTDNYRKMIAASTDRVFTEWEKWRNYFYGPAWESLKRRSLQDLQLFPSAEAEYFDGLSPEILEQWLEFNMEEFRIRVLGKIDRISTGTDGAVIVDYKKSWKKQTRAKFIEEDEQGGLLPPKIGYQLPFYILLARENGMKVNAAAYYSISGGAHFPVSGGFGVLSDEDADRLCELTLSEISRMAEESRKGNFTAPERCGGCGFRTVCRKRFNVRWINR